MLHVIFSRSCRRVVVGAGAAGLAAAHRLQSRGHTVLVLEASQRIGGRAHTDVSTFSTPMDLGCAWLHRADRNPLSAVARDLGFGVMSHDDAPEHIRDDGVEIDADARLAWHRARSRLSKAVASYGMLGNNDIAVSALVPDDRHWTHLAALANIAELDCGGPSGRTSTRGLQFQGDTWPNVLVREGMGEIVRHLGRGLTIALGQPVSAIDDTGHGVTVTAAGGTVRAAHCIVTVSTGVLRAEMIRFPRGLGNEYLRALEAMPMGHFNKVIVEFDRPIPGVAPGDIVNEGRTGDPERALQFLIGPWNTTSVVAYAGGDYGRHLSESPADTAVDEVVSRFTRCMGGLGAHRVVRQRVTDWSRNALFQGSYAYLQTGGGEARRILGAEGDSRVHFAGEATATELAQTCGGAYLTGIAAAQRVHEAVELA
ncbi:FAD-dependent oxidoreductase [Achromobacter sp. GG226]|uniref:flavin monoamine oxidase family protein n=1 Tax=Verticiella alkaliphila TaxID=2779529 RepID=UPI00209B8BA7|nr:NAD(P)/FAD-dependent oxidoreductase [Verticiella sp. GG226]MBU4611187.1 FAD-dependent oxidoreductase [Verticiella sp. GG226]